MQVPEQVRSALASRAQVGDDFFEHVMVPAVTLVDLAGDLDRVDFAHLDLQVGEAPLLRDRRTVACLGSQVACVMLATHSRAIDGLALEVLGCAGWELLRERPTGCRQSSGTM